MGTKRDLEAIEARRLAGARMLKRKMSQLDVARELIVSRQTVHLWVCAPVENRLQMTARCRFSFE